MRTLSSVCRTLALLAACVLLWPAGQAWAQGVTTSEVTGTVTDDQGLAVPGASVVAVHEPSGTRYEATSRSDGGFSIPGMRVGGPYTVTVSLTGFQSHTVREVNLTLGVAADVNAVLRPATVTEEITVTAQSDAVFSSERTGAATSIDRDRLASLPTISDRLDSFTRLTPQYSGGPFGGAFVGADNRSNNITVDGSYFNNSFGLSGAPGDRTGVAPISMAAVEAVQVNIAPYDVRQGNFVGAGVNTVTRSGTNSFTGSLYYWFRDESLVGTEAKGATVNPGTFDFTKIGGYFGGPIIRNKLFFFASIEDDTLTEPATTFVANRGEATGGNVTRVSASDLESLSSFLGQSFQYETGPFEGYDKETPARRYLAKLDYNLSDNHKFTFRYNHLNSNTDVLLSTSSSLGIGRTRSTSFLNFQNSNYMILENIRSGIAEWNAILGNNVANNLIVGYTTQDESRASRGTFFPFVDIQESGSTYTSFGFEPFTPSNELRYNTFQIQDSLTMHRGSHALTFGATAQRYESENVFFPGSQSAYVYNSLADFFTDARDHLANPNRTTSPVTLRRFQVRWANIPGLEKPVQPLEVWYSGVYAQDEWKVNRKLKVIGGVRLDVPKFGDTGFANSVADALTFRDENGAAVQYSTAKLPDSSILFSPRIGFNLDVTGARTTQVRGGTGVFTGPPAYVWISNQIGNTGVLTGFEQLDNTRNRPFHPDPDHYKPTNVTGAPASSFELALTDANFKFPQVWRTNLALDQKLPWNVTGTAELIYNRDVNGVYYINANLPAPQATLNGPDARPRWTSNRIHSQVANAVVLKNQDVGRSWHLSGSLEKNFRQGFLKAAYAYGEAKNTVDPGSIAFGSWNGNHHAGDPNNPGLGYSSGSPGHRAILAGSYEFNFLKFGATRIGIFTEGATAGNTSYTYSGDLNGDGGTGNDLIYIPRDTSEMNFQQFTAGGRTFTAAEQAAAWEAYIQQDQYMRNRRGQYAERNGVFLPMFWRTDLSFTQELFRNLGNKRHQLEFRADVLNFLNLINSDWGVAQRPVAGTAPFTQPLTNAAVDSQGRATYRLRVVNNELIGRTFEPTASIFDVYRVQFQLRYTFF
jgi:outer membrane receptor protein involved in Fe transport